jgi:hypothetical protein
VSEARLAQIEGRLIELMARLDADDVMLQVLAGQFAAYHPDWRDCLDMMRMSAETSLRQYNSGDPDAERMQQLSLEHVEETFRSLRNFLLATEQKRAAQQRPPPA